MWHGSHHGRPSGRAAGRINRVWLLLFACCVLPIRGAMAAVAQEPAWLIPIQMLDACGAGTLGVAVPIDDSQAMSTQSRLKGEFPRGGTARSAKGAT